MLCFPNAKINLGLNVIEKRNDGYHNLETIFLPISFFDALEIIETNNDSTFQSIGLPIPGDIQHNLVWKAYDLLKKDFASQIPSLQIYLHKVIPMGAGLGGGSSDAAHLLLLLNKEYHLGLEAPSLLKYALALGSDCPFFIKNKAQYATGRGEIMSDIEMPDCSNYSLELYLPQLHVSTATAFKHILPQKSSFDLRALSQLAIEDWQYYIKNDFETTVFQVHSELKALKNELIQKGAIYAAMSGTGAAIFAVVPKSTTLNITYHLLPYKKYYFESFLQP